jgi:hypothetical protein
VPPASYPLRAEGAFPPQSSAEVKNAWNYIFTPQYIFVVWYLVKHRGNFTFTLFVECWMNMIAGISTTAMGTAQQVSEITLYRLVTVDSLYQH